MVLSAEYALLADAKFSFHNLFFAGAIISAIKKSRVLRHGQSINTRATHSAYPSGLP